MSSPRLAGACVALLLALPAARADAQFHLADSLRGSTTGNATGGTFGADGWTVTGATDRIWYALPELASGSVEFTLANVTVANLPLPDHEIFAMYEDGYGIGEPIGYAPAFRGNHYKILARIYGMVEPSRVGAMKLMWTICPSGAPGYDTCGCGQFFDEPFASPGPWTGTPVRIRVEWGGGHARLLRDGVEVVGVDWSSTGLEFGPSDLHMMLGSPRNDGGLSALPIGATFSDLVVDGTVGALAMCPGGPTPDAGVPADGGVCAAGTGATADSTAAVWEPGPFPDPTDLNVEGDPGVPSAVVYLRFPPVTRAVLHATLTVETSSSPSAAGGSGQVCAVTGATWDEATLTWATRPAVSTTCSGGAHTVAPSEVVTWDVTSLVSPGGPVDLAIVSENPDGSHFLSREAGGCAHGPRLDVTLAPDGGASDFDASAYDAGGAVDGGSGDGGPATMDAGSHRPPASSGCCSVAGTREGGARSVLALLAALAIGVALRRRTRRPG